MRSPQTTFVVAAMAALCACSGGGGGGGSGVTGGTPGGGLIVNPTQLTFVYVIGSTTPSSQLVYGNWTANDAAYFGAAYLNGGSKPSWLSVPATASASGHYGSFSVGVNTYGATAGTRSTTFQVGIARADGSIIGSVDVTVTFIVKAFGASVTAISSTGVYGSSVAPASSWLTVSGQPTTTWTASVDPADWLSVTPASGTTGSGYVTVRFDPTGLGTGAHHGTVTFTSGGGAVDTVPVTLTVTSPTLTITPSPLALAGLGGNDTSPKKVQVSLNTGTNAYPYTVTSNVDWIDLAEGVTTASGTAGVFTAAPSLAALDWASGTTTWGKLTVTADVNGTPVSRILDVSYLPDDLKLLVSENGIALTKTPGLERLTRTVDVRTNRGVQASWTATSSQTWLSVTPSSGTTGDPLVLDVPDPTGLGTGLREATVTVSSTDTGLAHDTETIRVGLWVGDATPDLVTTVTAGYTEVATDPVRPYAYVADGTATIRIYNVHTGGLEGTITVPGSPELASMTTSGDGQRLWVLDGKLPLRKIVPIDLATRTAGTPWPVPGASNGSQIAFARTNGVPLVVTSAGAIYDAETVATVATYTTPDVWSAIAVNRDGSRFCVVALGYSPTDLHCHDLATTTRGTSPVLVGPTKAAPWNAISSGDDLALSPDGARLFVASGGIATFDASLPSGLVRLGTTGTATASNAIDVGPDGRLYCGTSAYGGPNTAFVYDASGNPLASYALTGFVERFLAVSGDGLRLVAGIGGYPSLYVTNYVKFVTLPPP